MTIGSKWNGSTEMGSQFKGTPTIGPGLKQKGRPWCDHCCKSGHKEDTCWDLHVKPSDWEFRQNNRNRGYQACVDPIDENNNSTPSSTFNPEQLKQLYKMFSSFQSSAPASSLAHKGNFLRALHTITCLKAPWIIDSGASYHMTYFYYLFSTYSTYDGNIKVKIADRSLSPVAGIQ